MNTKIIYFILFIVLTIKVNSFMTVENLDIESIMSDKIKKIKNKIGSNKIEKTDSLGNVNNLVQNALGKNNIVDIKSDEDTIENKVIETKPIVTSNNEEGGGITDIIIIIGFILVILILVKK